MHKLNKPIGILGGTFDPIHKGHIEIAKKVYEQLDLAEIRFIPCKQPLLKNDAQASTKQRVDLLKIACEPFPEFVIDEREIKRESPSYMVETLMSLRSELPQTPLCLIMGIDAYAELPRWYQWEKIITLAHLIIINRPHYSLPDTPILNDFYRQHHSNKNSAIHEKIAGFILTLTLPPLPYASRDIRQQISQGKNLEEALPPGVWQYIKKHGLYQKI